MGPLEPGGLGGSEDQTLEEGLTGPGTRLSAC